MAHQNDIRNKLVEPLLLHDACLALKPVVEMRLSGHWKKRHVLKEGRSGQKRAGAKRGGSTHGKRSKA